MKKTTISKKLLVLTLALAMMLSLCVFTVSAADPIEFWDLRNEDNVTVTELTGTINGAAATITCYTGYYLPEYGRYGTDQRINIYVPSNADQYSAIFHLVNNSGWSNNGFPTNTIANNFNYSFGTNGNIGQAIARGMIVISYGCRSRSLIVSGSYVGHSPATMSDTKAALRYVRYNCEPGRLLYGLCNPEIAFVTGSSGGGALSVILAACGNTPDYFPALYESGAAGIEKIGDSYISTISDAYYGTIAYCPITDLPMADQAYEFTYNTSRTMRPAAANVNSNLVTPLADNPVMLASNWLANDFTGYINGLGLYDEFGVPLTASFTGPVGAELHGTTGGTFKDAMTRLLERGIDKAIDEWNSGYVARSVANSISINANGTVGTGAQNDAEVDVTSWLLINGAAPAAGIPAFGSYATIYDLDEYLTLVPNSALKISPAFDNMGLKHAGTQNENNLTGRTDQAYSHWHEYAWNDAGTAVADVGYTNTGLTWDEFLQTDDGALVALQAKMTTPIPYLLGAANIQYLQYTPGSDECDVAPYWYVRHGAADRDTSFAVGTLLYYSLLANNQVEDDFINLNFAWRKPHSGNYDILEAFDWVDSVMAAAANKVIGVDLDAFVTKLNGNKNDLTITIIEYYFNAPPVEYKATISINNNAAGTYTVGPYKVYVDTKGNDQIRACYIA